MIESICPDCESPFEADEKDIGEIYVCKSCGIECIVPSIRVNPGDDFGDWTIQYPIGAGSSSEVHLAEHADTGQQAAVKVLFTDGSTLLDVKRFFREARNVSTFDHGNLIKIYDMGQRDEAHYLVMEYVEGQPLDHFLDDHGPLPEVDALSIVRDVASVMDYVWQEKQLVHRDIKPSNIMLSYDGRTKVMDLGIAKSLMFDLTQLTEPDTILGTPIYMSPEQCAPGKRIDQRSDIYSLGATLYNLVTDRFPFKGKDPMDLVKKHLFSKPKDPRIFIPDLSDETAELILMMMAKSASRRPQTWQELVDIVDDNILKLSAR